jgi:hypothetical protein
MKLLKLASANGAWGSRHISPVPPLQYRVVPLVTAVFPWRVDEQPELLRNYFRLDEFNLTSSAPEGSMK